MTAWWAGCASTVSGEIVFASAGKSWLTQMEPRRMDEIVLVCVVDPSQHHGRIGLPAVHQIIRGGREVRIRRADMESTMLIFRAVVIVLFRATCFFFFQGAQLLLLSACGPTKRTNPKIPAGLFAVVRCRSGGVRNRCVNHAQQPSQGTRT